MILSSVRHHSHFIAGGDYKATCFDYKLDIISVFLSTQSQAAMHNLGSHPACFRGIRKIKSFVSKIVTWKLCLRQWDTCKLCLRQWDTCKLCLRQCDTCKLCLRQCDTCKLCLRQCDTCKLCLRQCDTCKLCLRQCDTCKLCLRQCDTCKLCLRQCDTCKLCLRQCDTCKLCRLCREMGCAASCVWNVEMCSILRAVYWCSAFTNISPVPLELWDAVYRLVTAERISVAAP